MFLFVKLCFSLHLIPLDLWPKWNRICITGSCTEIHFQCRTRNQVLPGIGFSERPWCSTGSRWNVASESKERYEVYTLYVYKVLSCFTQWVTIKIGQLKICNYIAIPYFQPILAGRLNTIWFSFLFPPCFSDCYSHSLPPKKP